jgi:DNA transformation protein
MMGELAKLPNIGEKLETQLNEVGIHSFEDLKRLGSREAWLQVLHIDPSACLMRLSALEGAIQGVRWHHLDPSTKQSLQVYYRQYKPKNK